VLSAHFMCSVCKKSRPLRERERDDEPPAERERDDEPPAERERDDRAAR
jgi:hypothetical protein